MDGLPLHADCRRGERGRRGSAAVSALVLVTAVLGGGCTPQRLQEKQSLVDAVERMGGSVCQVDFSFDIDNPTEKGAMAQVIEDSGPIDLVILRGPWDNNSALPDMSHIGDEHLAELTELPAMKRVKSLMLNDTAVTDAGLAHLSRLTNLRGLDLRGTRVTEEGVAQLQRALPNCKIERTSGSDE